MTTVITGNCGSSELNLAQWFEKLDKLGLGINVASLVGHNTVRREVMGTANRLATPEEITKMQSLVDRAMREGGGGRAQLQRLQQSVMRNTAERHDRAQVRH